LRAENIRPFYRAQSSVIGGGIAGIVTALEC
jgi:hypothetical protein